MREGELRMRRVLGLVVVATCLAATAVRADQPGEAAPDGADALSVARHQIRDLGTAARNLKRLSKQVEKSDGPEDYAAWLATSARRVETLASRWSAGVDLYQREFPAESLAVDPERASLAATFIGEKNREFLDQLLELKRELLAANAGFEAAPAPSVGRTRAVLDGLGR